MANSQEFKLEDFEEDEFSSSDFDENISLGFNKIVDRDIFGREFERGERSLIGNIFERPGAAIRSAIQGGVQGKNVLESFRSGALVPEEVPTFLKLSQQAPVPTIRSQTGNVGQDVITNIGRFKMGLARDISALGADIVTNPADVLTGIGLKGLSSTKLIAESEPIRKFGKFLTKERRISLPKFQSDFINQNLVPRTKELFTKSVNNFTSGVQKFIKNKLNASDDLIRHISGRGIKNVKATQSLSKDSLDDVARNMKQGFDLKNNEVTKLYQEALGNVDDSALIPIDDSFKELTKVLQKHGFVDNVGNVTSIAKSPSADPKLSSLTDIYEFLSSNRGAGTTLIQRGEIGGVNKTIWQNIRDILSRTSIKGGRSRITKDVIKISDVLHDQASKSGLKGIDKARKASREFFENADLLDEFNPSRVQNPEAKLKKVFDSPKVNQNLKRVDDYLKSDFSNQTKDIVSARKLKEFEDLGADFIDTQTRAKSNLLERSLKSAVNPADFKKEKQFLEELLGKSDELNTIFQDIRSFGKGQSIKRIGGRAAATGAAIGGGILIGGSLRER